MELPPESMTECDRRTLYKDKITGEKTHGWKQVRVADLTADVESRDLRCTHCQGAVSLHRRTAADGPQDHVKHRSRQDSEGCRGGAYFQGTHRPSSHPVV